MAGEGFGGNSRQRAKAKKAQERLATAVTDKVLQQINATSMLQHPETAQTGDNTIGKLRAIWSSTPVWAALGMLFAVITSQLSRFIVFAAVYLIVAVEVVLARFFERTWLKWVGNATILVLLLGVSVLLLKLVPKPQTLPNIDQQANAVVSKLIQQLPWLTQPSKVGETPHQEEGQRTVVVRSFGPPSPDSRGYLNSVPINVSYNQHYFPTDGISVKLRTTNIGQLQILPNASLWGYVRFRHQMTAEEENQLFNTMNLGGGPGTMIFTENNYWDKGISREFTVSGTPDFESPDALTQEINDFFDPNGSLYAYVFARHIARDRVGLVVTETCFYFKGSDLSQTFSCHGHNGPANLPR